MSLRIGSVNVSTMRKEDEVVDMAARRTFGFLLSSGDLMERRGCEKVG